MNERDSSIDILKGLAIFCVVLGHLPIGEFIGKIIYLFHMPCFFLVSGYLAFPSMQGDVFYGKLIVAKWKRLLLPYFIWSGIALAYNIFLCFVSQGNILNMEFKEIFWEIFIEAKSVWFLIVLFFSFIFLGIFRLLENKFSSKYGFCIYIVGWIMLCIILPDNLFRFNKFKFFFPYFLIGYILNKYNLFVRIKENKKISIVITILFFLLLYIFKDSPGIELFYTLNIESMSIAEISIGVMLSFMGITSLIFVSTVINRSKFKYIIKEWGIYSLDIYLIHMFFIKALHFFRVGDTSDMFQLFYNFLCSVIIISIIILIVKKVGAKMKLYQWITGKKC